MKQEPSQKHLPQEFQSRIHPELLVRTGNRDSFEDSLRNDLPIELISVVQLQSKQMQCMFSGEGQNANVQIFKGLTRDRR